MVSEQIVAVHNLQRLNATTQIVELADKPSNAMECESSNSSTVQVESEDLLAELPAIPARRVQTVKLDDDGLFPQRSYHHLAGDALSRSGYVIDEEIYQNRLSGVNVFRGHHKGVEADPCVIKYITFDIYSAKSYGKAVSSRDCAVARARRAEQVGRRINAQILPGHGCLVPVIDSIWVEHRGEPVALFLIKPYARDHGDMSSKQIQQVSRARRTEDREMYRRALASGIAAIRDVCLGLSCLDRMGIVHRDIKPGNIVMCDGNGRLTDFGIAIDLKDEALGEVTRQGLHNDDPFQTQFGAFVGTPSFASPEQIRGLVRVDHRSDLYSLGATLYMLVVGEDPFAGCGKTSNEVLSARRAAPDNFPSIPKGMAWVSNELRAIVEKATAADPNDRYQTAAEFSKALRSYVKREEHRAQKIWTAVGASALTLLSGLGGALWGSTRNTSDSVTPQQQGADELGVARVDQLINEFRAGEIGAEEALARLALIKDLSADDRRLSSIVESYINQIESRRIQVLTTAEE